MRADPPQDALAAKAAAAGSAGGFASGGSAPTRASSAEASRSETAEAGAPTSGAAAATRASSSPGQAPRSEWPLWEVFVRSKAGLDHKHCGSLHAADAAMAIQLARDVYTRRQEGSSIWVVRSDQIVASDPGEKATYFDPMEDKVYRHPTFYELPKSVDHM
jgi:ring-1,2-phenylacetyl-CoA epoxidase subunit PaaB